MSFTVEVVKVGVENRGKYKIATVDHKTTDGKVDSKKLMSFTFPDVFNAFALSKQGDVFEIESKKIKNEKDGKEYWTWVSASGVGKNTGGQAGAKVAVRSSYETPEERAARQVYIVRQSSIANAIEFLDSSGKDFDVEDVVTVAKQFESYVFGNVEVK